jgi:hypothetical protein
MITHCSVIPGIDEHRSLWKPADGLLISKQGSHPVTVGPSSGVREDGDAGKAATGSVVANGDVAGDARIGNWRAGQQGGVDVEVGEVRNRRGEASPNILRRVHQRDSCSGGGLSAISHVLIEDL